MSVILSNFRRMNIRRFVVCDAKNGNPIYDLEIDELTLMFLDTLMAELNAGTTKESVGMGYNDYFECKKTPKNQLFIF